LRANTLVSTLIASKIRPTTDIGLKPAVFSRRVFDKSCYRAGRGHTLMSDPTWGVKNVIGEVSIIVKVLKNYLYRKQ
jgi:hypothetical protein